MAAQEQGGTLEAALARDSRVKSVASAAELAGILDPTTYVGLAPELVDRALARTKAEGWLAYSLGGIPAAGSREAQAGQAL
jgi:adenylosuccinate lyase